jgi:rhodanese-related sulfurtransferase
MTDSSDHIQPAYGYAGDISPELACRWWQAGEAVLVDVRTSAEIAWVGFVPGSVHIPIKEWPSMAPNPRFDEQVQSAVPPGGKVVFLCRSATDLGLTAYNILEGFEGDPDAQAHRNTLEGWRARGLPWAQN